MSIKAHDIEQFQFSNVSTYYKYNPDTAQNDFLPRPSKHQLVSESLHWHRELESISSYPSVSVMLSNSLLAFGLIARAVAQLTDVTPVPDSGPPGGTTGGGSSLDDLISPE